MSRQVCDACGGWLDDAPDGWAANVGRAVAWARAHAHPAGAPVVFRVSPFGRDAWSAAVTGAGMVSLGFAAGTAGAVVAHAGPPGTSSTADPRVRRVVATSPGELAWRLAAP